MVADTDKSLRVVFMGTPEFAIPSLNAIIDNGYDVPLVVSTPDRKRGRGRKLQPSAVKERALELELEVEAPEKLKDPLFIERLEAVKPDVICVVAFRILPESVYSIASSGSFNLHGSLLPKYRGAAPINWAIINGEAETGVTTFFLKRKVDTGNIILQRSIPIESEMTAGELHDVMKVVGAEVVVETLKRIESGNVEVLPQDSEQATPAPKIFREDCRIRWDRDTFEINNRIRGLSPYPGAFTEVRDANLKILRTRITERSTLSPAEIAIVDERLFVGTNNGDLEILELQMEGRKRMASSDFLRGGGLVDGEFLSR